VSALPLLPLAAALLGSPAAPKRPLVLAYYYTWYGLPTGAAGGFGHWASSAPSKLLPKGADPRRFERPPAIREIASCAYPLIGPYDSMDREVVRWHMRLAKAAGIDGFLVDWWGPATWQKPPGWTHDVFVKTVLPVAEEERFKVALFDETPQFVEDFEQVCAWTADALRRFKDSPAWLRIDGRPVWGVYQLWEGRLTAARGRELVERTERAVGPVYWIVDRMRARPGGAEIELFTPEDWLAVPGIQAFSGYAMFSTWRVDTYERLAPLYRDWVAMLHRAGKKAMVPVHPGHDNSRVAMDPYPMSRRNGETLRAFLRAARESGADFIGVTSWNEWPETTVVEPSRDGPDPYRYLRILAEFQGRRFAPPPLPPLSSLDPPMADLLRDEATRR